MNSLPFMGKDSRTYICYSSAVHSVQGQLPRPHLTAGDSDRLRPVCSRRPTPVPLPTGSNLTGVVPPLPFLSSDVRGLPPLCEEGIVVKGLEQYVHVRVSYGVLSGIFWGHDALQKPLLSPLCLVQRREGWLTSSSIVILAYTEGLLSVTFTTTIIRTE